MAQGFFSDDETQEILVENRTNDPLCNKCGLFKGCSNPKLDYTGEGRKDVLIIAEANGRNEDRLGTQLIGDVGQSYRKQLSQYGLDLEKDFWKHNAVNCFPHDTEKGITKVKTPTTTQITCCQPFIQYTIQRLKPKIIWLLGGIATKSFYRERFSDNADITRFRGLKIPDRDTGAWVFPMFHPSYLYRQSTDKNLESVYNRDLKYAINNIDIDPPSFIDFNKRVNLVYNFQDIIDILRQARGSGCFVFDFETNGLRANKELSKIATISFSTNKNSAYSFPFMYQDFFSSKEQNRIRLELNCILNNENIKKVAHNLKFEHSWSKHVLEVDVKNWYWDSMLCSHSLDSRKDFTGLKFQSYINFGVNPYDKEMKQFLDPKGKEYNKVDEAPLEKLLLYGGLDSILEHHLFLKQEREISKPENKDLKKGFEFFMDGLRELCEVEGYGVSVNTELLNKIDDDLTVKINGLEKEILEGDEAETYKKVFNTNFRLDSDTQLKQLLYDVLKLPQITTEKGNLSVSMAAITKQSDHPFIAKYLNLDTYKTIQNTFIRQFKREEINGKLYPMYNLHIPRSYRGCIAKGTLILAVRNFTKYPKGVPIEDINVGDYVYCFDNNLNPAIRKVLWAGKTGEKQVIRLYYSVNGGGGKGYLDVTPEHKIRLIDGTYEQAQNLIGDFRKPEESNHVPKIRVLSCKRVFDTLRFTGHLKHGNGIYEHRLIYKELIGSLDDNEKIHHKNKIHLDHTLTNLQKMTLSDHSRLHAKDTLNSPIAKKNSLLAMKKNVESGYLKKISKKGVDHPNYLNLSKFHCLKQIAKVKGSITKINYDFNTFKNYLKQYKINEEIIRLRYDKKGKYISKSRLLQLTLFGRAKIQKILGHNHYRLIKLFNYYNIPITRKWGNQYGEFVPGNHVITKIEWINKTVDVYDLEVEEFNNFFANEICVHNSSSNPNVQNIPARNKDAKKLCRMAIVPSEGFQFLESDYKGMEVCIAACLSKDKSLIKYVSDPTTDMHRDTARDIWMLAENDVTKMIRFYAKNMWVFAQFYGSYYVNCGNDLWEMRFEKTASGIPLHEHLKSKGIRNKNDFLSHLEAVEHEFWYNRFNDYRLWKEEENKKYLKLGYVELPFGFRRGGYCVPNQVKNTPIQGTAFHCLLWTLMKVNKALRIRKMKSRIIWQIHDCTITNTYPSELQEVIALIDNIGTKKLREVFPFLTVPLKIDHEVGPIDGSWYEVEEMREQAQLVA